MFLLSHGRPKQVRQRDGITMSNTEMTIEQLCETVSELERLIQLLAERLGVTVVVEPIHCEDK